MEEHVKRMLVSIAALAFAAFAVTSAHAAQASSATHAKSAHTKAALLDINSATESELAALPGVGDAYAKKIVDGRPYKAKDELVSRKIVPETSYKKFSAKVIAKEAH
jgi:competence protein ComEA